MNKVENNSIGHLDSEVGKIESALRKSPINYFSDLFIAAMVVAWIVVIIIMLIMAVFSTVYYADNSIWGELGSLVAIPLSAGGAIWMVKNSVQHAIAYNKGEQAHMDFPKVNAGEDFDGFEESILDSCIEDEDNDEAG